MELGLYQSYGDSASGNSLFLFILNCTYSAIIKVDFERRFEGSEPGVNLFVSLDGTDCSINEQSPFSPLWYSHKLNVTWFEVRYRTQYRYWRCSMGVWWISMRLVFRFEACKKISCSCNRKCREILQTMDIKTRNISFIHKLIQTLRICKPRSEQDAKQWMWMDDWNNGMSWCTHFGTILLSMCIGFMLLSR